LAWPQFNLAGRWIDFDELYGNAIDLAARSSDGFSNAGETLFEAVEHTAVDFLGKTRGCGTPCSGAKVDLSDYVVKDEGLYNSRDELFKEFGSLQHSLRGRAFELIYGGRKSICGLSRRPVHLRSLVSDSSPTLNPCVRQSHMV
jgi:hypothetical protein